MKKKLQEEEEKEAEERNKEKMMEKVDGEIVEDGLKDIVGAKYLKMCHNVCFLETAVYSVEVPVREHSKEEVTEAKKKETENLELYEVFEEVEDVGQEVIGSRWIVTKKEINSGNSNKSSPMPSLVSKNNNPQPPTTGEVLANGLQLSVAPVRRYKQYTEETLQQALREIMEGQRYVELSNFDMY